MSSERPRILWILPSLEIGGTERQAALILPRLTASFETEVLTLYCLGSLAEELRGAGVKVQCLEGRSLYDRRIGSKLRDRVAQGRPALIHSFLWDANVLTAWALRKALDQPLLTSRREIGLWRRRRHRWAEQWTNRFAARIVVNSEATRQYVCRAEGVSPERVVVVPNALDAARFQQVDRNTARGRLEIASDTLVFGVVASLAEKKGHGDLLQALQQVREQLPSHLLLVIGDGPERSRLETRVRQLGLGERVRFLGLRRDVPEVLPALDVLVHPSHTESMPNAVLEGMAAALPVIATDVGGTREAVDSGHTGVLVESHSPDALGAALVDLAGDPELRKRLGEAAQRRVEEYFSIEAAGGAYQQLYREVLESLSR